jgi:ABC-type glycerol-3-phosphate transport system substrate-binding protein
VTTRRAVLRTAAAGALAGLAGTVGTAGLAGCTGTGRGTGAVEVAVVWSGGELAEFRRVVRDYPGRVEVVSARDDIDALLSARHQAGALPDVAILSRPGLVASYAGRGWLEPLPDRLAGRFPDPWADLLRVGGTLFGAWVKAAHKSLFWYLPSLLPDPPSTWGGLVDAVRAIGEPGGPAPLSIGAADGWVLTDWLENLLASLDEGDLYRRLAAAEPAWQSGPVRVALDELARVWGTSGAFPGGGRRALLTQFDESVIQVVSGRQAVMVFEADFVSAVEEQFHPPHGAEPLRTFRFPALGRQVPLIVGGDAAVVLRGSRAGQDFVDWLTGPDAFRPWIDSGGYLSPNLTIPDTHYPAGRARELAGEIREPSGGLRFDLSDQLPGRLSGQTFWTILQDFFASVSGRASARSDAVDGTVRRLDQAVRRYRRDAAGGS